MFNFCISIQLHCIWYNMYLYKVCHAKIQIIMPIMLMFEARINSGLGLQQKKDRWVWKKFMLHPGTSCWVWKRKTAEGCFWLKLIKYICKINLIQVYYCELQDNIWMGANFLQELLLCIMVKDNSNTWQLWYGLQKLWGQQREKLPFLEKVNIDIATV